MKTLRQINIRLNQNKRLLDDLVFNKVGGMEVDTRTQKEKDKDNCYLGILTGEIRVLEWIKK